MVRDAPQYASRVLHASFFACGAPHHEGPQKAGASILPQSVISCAGAEGVPKKPAETDPMIHYLLRALTALAGLVLGCASACAHPHVWVTVQSEVVYAPDGSITGVRHAWTFDDMFSVFATQGIESKKKGQFTREELAPLAEVNVTSLKEYDFFTYAKVNGKPVEFNDPQPGYYLEFNPKDTVLTLYFTLQLKTPTKANDLTIEVFDREFFVDFSFAEKTPVKLVGAPTQCKLSVLNPEQMNADLSARLSQLGPNQRDPSLTIGAEYANKIVVKCP
jgi:ABC-type uncharacterized transport system substrate-binding protein